MPAYVAYYRVSTQKQGQSGLGLDAQRTIVSDYVSRMGGTVAAEYTEVESGRKDDRAQLASAIAYAKSAGASLLIAKLDRLARSVSFVANLMDSKVDFVACDIPNATPLMLHIYSAFAEHEAKIISERVRNALAAAKVRGVVLGGYRGVTFTAEQRAAGAEATAATAKAFAVSITQQIEAARASGAVSLRGIADYLNVLSIKTARGGKWSAVQVQRVTCRLATT